MNVVQKKLVVWSGFALAWLLHVFFVDWFQGGKTWSPTIISVGGETVLRADGVPKSWGIGLGIFLPLVLLALVAYLHLGGAKSSDNPKT